MSKHQYQQQAEDPSHSGWTYGLVLTATLVLLFTLYYSQFTINRVNTVHLPMSNAMSVIKLEITTAHLWFEEILAGDRNESLDLVWQRIDRVDQLVGTLLDGGGIDHEKFISRNLPAAQP